ncbi:DNA excision repair protein ERCC-3 [Corynebacterium appendicis CIP 107643]|uniref:DNA 3'-5' helicase n=2 Tax=Corynebacterium appendicis TaxID=163202 RepID=A0A1N7JZG5_9CORY|nr:Type III restriction enzyme, res subunit [Corynebacterium appendicis CIP 107643]SIS54717.1 DNA excision repair protein ERCC-3 [Corynebacterium appendicis CIP 107643]
MSRMPLGDGPLIVQSDKTVLLDVAHPEAGAARAALAPYAELERAPEHVHTYRITPLALWNARAAGFDAEQAVDVLERYSRFPVPQALLIDVAETMARYGRVRLLKHPAHGLILEADDAAILTEITRNKKIQPMVGKLIDDTTAPVHPSERGRIKQELTKLGWPVDDRAGYVDGESHPIRLTAGLDGADRWELRDYQQYATESFWEGGSGVVVLPCGAGKTIVGAASMAQAQTTTLILVTNTVAGRQWRDELLRRTTLTPEEIGEYSGERKEIRPVTIATYQVVTRKTKGEYKALELFDSRDWGLIIYDEVHLLPAPVFRMAADLQSRRRLGLTATLVREDHREDDVFSLIGPKRYDAPWKELEMAGYIATAECVEVRTTLTEDERMMYATAETRERYRIAACSEGKLAVVDKLLAQHSGQQTLIIGAFIEQLEDIAARTSAPLIDGKTSTKKRETTFDAFRNGEIQTLVVSKVANFSIDLPEAAVGIQVSGTFGSRQEEAQRLGRLLRPKADGAEALFYTVVARDTLDAEYAMHRQRFLAEQGYAYRLVDAADL